MPGRQRRHRDLHRPAELEDPEQRTFELDPSSKQFTINSTELRFSKLDLDKVDPILPAVRRSNRGMTKAQSCRGEILNKKYVVPIETEQAILQSCC